MAKQYRLARKMKKIALTEAAKELGVSQPTLSNWESERKAPSIDAVIRMADYYGVTTDFLLGRTKEEDPRQDWLSPVEPDMLPAFHETPVYSLRHGWAFVDAVEKVLRFANGEELSLSDAGELFILPPAYMFPDVTGKVPLQRNEIKTLHRVWVEPISSDAILRTELRGWYQVKKRYVENEIGQRFYFDMYESKWLAFKKEETEEEWEN